MSEADEKKAMNNVAAAVSAKIESAKIILMSRILSVVRAIFVSTVFIVLLMIWRIFR